MRLATALLLLAAAGCGDSMIGGMQPGGQVSIAVSPAQAHVGAGGSVQLTATVTGTDDHTVIWSVSEAQGGTIDAGGRYTAPQTPGAYHVAAALRADPTVTAAAAVTVGPDGAPKTYVPGQWTEITPPVDYLLDAAHIGPVSVAIDPSAPDTIYLGIEGPGLFRSTDRGATWTALGTSDPDPYDDTTTFLDLPITISVDPADSKHLYVTEGVRGANNGFWVSHDGGATWSRKKRADLTTRAIDPTDFRHVLVGNHEFIPYLLETRDGGDTWRTIETPFGDSGSFGVSMLFHPATHQGNDHTWLLQGPGHFRTEDAGDTWTKVSEIGAVHGGNATLYAPDGVLYSGAWDGMARTTDNGLTWERITDGIAHGSFQAMTTDGTHLYTMQTNNWGTDVPLLVSTPENGKTWTPFAAGAQKFALGATQMVFEPGNRMLYSVNMSAGLWALKLPDP